MHQDWQVIGMAKNVQVLNEPVLIEGLPGIGNVGKVAIDFLIEELKAKKLCSLFSYGLPHSVFVNEDDLVELPSIEIYYKRFGKKGKRDMLILTGDVQPLDEAGSYAFCDKVIELAKQFGVKEVITTGGIGLQEIPKKPRVYITGNDGRLVAQYAKNMDIETQIHDVVGPIIGVSGLLLGLGSLRGMPGIALLAETFGHPLYLGVKGAHEILKVLAAKLDLKLNVGRLTKEIEQLEQRTMKRTKDLGAIQDALKSGSKKETIYIG